MKIIVLGGITRITIFQIGELGDLFEFTFVPVIYQENIITVVGRKYGISGRCSPDRPVGRINDSGFIWESYKRGIQVIIYIICDLFHIGTCQVISENIRLTVFDGTQNKCIVIEHIFHILNLVEISSSVTIRLYFETTS